MHLELVKMAIEDPSLMAAWGQPEEGGLPLDVVRQRTYCNQLVLWWEMSYEVGAVTDEWIRYIARELFKGEVSRQWWKDVRHHRHAYATPRKLQVLTVLNEECETADRSANTAVLAPSSAKTSSEPDGDPVIRITIDLAVGRHRFRRSWGGRP